MHNNRFQIQSWLPTGWQADSIDLPHQRPAEEVAITKLKRRTIATIHPSLRGEFARRKAKPHCRNLRVQYGKVLDATNYEMRIRCPAPSHFLDCDTFFCLLRNDPAFPAYAPGRVPSRHLWVL